jgi:PPOX class probable F420-dependent enzyme
VKTRVWFVEQGGKLYIWTIASSGKAKRIRNNSRVRVSPSTFSGAIKENWVEARARFIDPATAAPFTELMRRKYGFQFWLLNRFHGKGRVIIEIEPHLMNTMNPP